MLPNKLWLFVLLACGATAVEYRLPKDFIPVTYQVDLVVQKETLEGKDNKFTGTVRIEIERAEGSTAQDLKVHSSAHYLQIGAVRIDNEAIPAERYSVDNVTDILTVTQIETTLQTFALEVDFSGLHGDDMYGFYLSSYDDDGVDKYLVTTQFQPTHGRRAFPMFDEPEFKAKFTISITHPVGYEALSNTNGVPKTLDNDLIKTEFEQTVTMSSYLIAFVVSEFTCQASAVSESVPHRICSNDKLQDWRQLALDDGPVILESLNKYTDFNYNKSFNKLDQVAIPDFSAGAMENWGLVTYREILLLWTKEESTNRQMQRISTVIAHELAHMWFGNLATTRWWSTTFLNEGFATFFETFTTHEVHPDWELDKQFVLADHQVALETDSLLTAKALQSEANSPSEVSGKFDTISYSKGGSVLRMVEHMLGKEVFQSGVRTYLQDRAYNYTEPSQLWDHLEKASESQTKPATVNQIMTNWIELSGFPLVEVMAHGTGAHITQKRFVFGASNSSHDRYWFIPISYTQSTDANKFQDTLPKQWLNATSDSSVHINLDTGAEWIVLNNQASAFYRVNYDTTLWNKITAALQKDNFDGIVDLNRAQIVNDLFALAKSGIVDYSRVFSTIGFLSKDTSYYSWYSALDGFNFLQRRIGTTSELGQSVQKHLNDLMQEVIKSVSFEDVSANQVDTHKQVLVQTWACQLNLTSCTEPALQLFKEYKQSQGTTRPSNPNLRSIVYCNGLRYSEDYTDWEFLWEQFQTTDLPSEKGLLITALGCTKNTTLLNKYLLYSTNTSLVRSQDAASVYSAVYTSGNEQSVNTAFEFLVANHELISESYKAMNALGNIIRGIAERFTSQEQLDQLQTLIDNLQDGSFKTEATGALSNAKSNLEWVETKRKELEQLFLDNTDPLPDSAHSVVLSGVLSVICLVVFGLVY